MSQTERSLNILRVIGAMEKVTRMEVFHSFDGTISWHEIKVRITGLCADGVIQCIPGISPENPKFWVLTDIGRKIFEDFFPEDATTEIVED